MPLQKTLATVERDIQNGDLGKARDRLLSLLIAYPDNLELRYKLGEVYWELRFPAMAGRYWYLEERTNPRIQSACTAFERAFGHDPLRMFLAIKFKGDLSLLQGTYAGQTLGDLRQRAQEKYPYHPIFRKPEEKGAGPKRQSAWSNRLIAIGCGLVALLGLALMIVGLITVISRL